MKEHSLSSSLHITLIGRLTTMISRQQKPQTSSLCKSIGHGRFVNSTDNYRRCTRASCCCAERLVNGTWVEVTTTTKRSTRKASSTAPISQPIKSSSKKGYLLSSEHVNDGLSRSTTRPSGNAKGGCTHVSPLLSYNLPYYTC